MAQNYFAANGQAIYGGRAAPSVFPLWRRSRAVNEWAPILNTAGAGGAEVDEFCGMALARGTELIAALCGGHSHSDNRTTGIDLSMDVPGWGGVPGWKILNPTSAGPDRQMGVSHYLDGKPTSRHVRHLVHYMPTLDRVVTLGAHDIYNPGGGSKPTVDVFDLDALTWAPAHTYPDVMASAVNGGAVIDVNGDGWVAGTYKFTAATKVWSAPLTTSATWNVRYPWALAAPLGLIFGMCYGDGYTGGTSGLAGPSGDGLLATRQIGNVQTNLTINPSAARTQFIADAPKDAGMEYDPILGAFLFYTAKSHGRIYKIIPNATTAWDIEIFSYGAGNVIPPASISVCSRFRYVPALKGFIYLPDQVALGTQNLYFLPTAN